MSKNKVDYEQKQSEGNRQIKQKLFFFVQRVSYIELTKNVSFAEVSIQESAFTMALHKKKKTSRQRHCFSMLEF